MVSSFALAALDHTAKQAIANKLFIGAFFIVVPCLLNVIIV
ncbi:hypothetical protein VITU9109_16688 [Vibrio tubiashii ATCC 19109]|uniref:Transporter n=1 Tax=Vibrio tubiashii ATCC 19109 TaxID=1051646 RepID=A0ABN0DB11_9VIBR|nr:hypothetical protein VITU9109_16688 [Vibrio tubiashii ATCC 19109]